MKTYCVLLASGTGSRFGADCPKQFVRIKNRMVVEYTLKACDCGVFDRIILVVSAPYVEMMRRLVLKGGYQTEICVIGGGASRKESCRLGMEFLGDDEAYVVIHNGVQPFITKQEFLNCLAALKVHSAVTNGSPCVYTVLETDENRIIQNMPVRSQCFNDLGPECFRLSLLRRIFTVSENDDSFTNFTGAVMKYGLGRVFVAEGNPKNTKITYPEDIVYASKLFDAMEK